MKRKEGELKYDYCARRLLEQYRTAIVKLGRAGWVSCQVVVQKHRDTGEIRRVKEVMQGTYRRSLSHERKLSKKEKKVLKKNKTRLKYRLAAQQPLRGCCGSDTKPLIVSP